VSHTAPPPKLIAFVPCWDIQEDKAGGVRLTGLPLSFTSHHFPAATTMGFFARLTDGHGRYALEVQLHNEEGDIVWRDGPPEPWVADDPLTLHTLMMRHLNPVYPGPGIYYFVLAANDVEVARQRFIVKHVPRSVIA
jgi:hypothetical protein